MANDRPFSHTQHWKTTISDAKIDIACRSDTIHPYLTLYSILKGISTFDNDVIRDLHYSRKTVGPGSRVLICTGKMTVWANMQ